MESWKNGAGAHGAVQSANAELAAANQCLLKETERANNSPPPRPPAAGQSEFLAR